MQVRCLLRSFDGEVMNKGIPKETNPPLVLRSSKGSPLSSGGGMGDQEYYQLIFFTSYSQCHGKLGSTISTTSEQTCFTICVEYDDKPFDGMAPWDSSGVDIDRSSYRYSLSRISLSAGDTLSKHAMLKNLLSSLGSHNGRNELGYGTSNPKVLSLSMNYE
ncbi:hypothetical protein SADUNF_Sadunf08G0140900 [Salix dunnii]|uniref:Uncharacterized protein n=1 Tax=Salix dunnii TaxID=1413687 RepID=A0A835K344_9ROSI|nr:hypothetical protein SADUNF_Sadunf08G0140900 [Salix dunnii]